MEISFYLKSTSTLTKTSIYARISYEGKQIKYYPSEKINPKFWNKKKHRAKEDATFIEYPEFNTRLNNIEADILNIYRKYLNDNNNTLPAPDALKKILNKELKKFEPIQDKGKTFLGFFAELIQHTINGGRVQPVNGKPYSTATIQIYNATLKKLIAYQGKRKRIVDFKNIDIDFYTNYTEYLAKELILSTNSIGKEIKIIKVVINEATERGLNDNMQYKSKRFSTTSEKTDSIYLNEVELQALEKLDLKDNLRLDNARDLFLIGCYSGLRFSDFSILTPEQMSDGFIRIKEQTKTGQPIVIPIHPVIKRIIEKYNGGLPNTIVNQKLNKFLKEIGEKLPCLNIPFSTTITKGGLKVIRSNQKWELLTTHSGRRSFASNEYLNGMPSITIMAITGHKTEKAFLSYIKLTPDEHAQLLKMHWDKRNNLMAV